VLAYLAIIDKPVARAALIELFWGDQPEDRARHSLSDTLSSLRRVLGPAAVSARLADVQLDTEGARLSVDALELARAAADGRHSDVIAIYEGPFLPAFAVPGSLGFDEWTEQERLRLSKLFSRSCRAVCLEFERQNDWASSLALGQRWLEADPLSTGAQLAVLKGHAGEGGPDALKTALQEFRRLEQRLSRDFGALPDRDVRELVESWQSRLNDAGEMASGEVASAAAPTATAPSPAPASLPSAVAARSRRRVFIGGAAAAVAVAAAGLVGWSMRKPPVSGEPRWVVVADVENKTGDSVFDRTVSVALAAALAQSPHVRVVAPDRISRALVRMRRTDTDPTLSEALAREVAQRDGVPVVVVPSVHAAGNAYELTTRTLDATTGAVLAFAAVRADDRASVLDALDRLGHDVRRGLGETSRSIRANSVSLPLATTASLDALKKYAEGQRAFRSSRMDDAESLWREAVKLDAHFALPYAGLGQISYRNNHPAEGDSLYSRAFLYLGTLTEREQVMIRASAKSSRGDHDASARMLEAYLAKDPQDLGVLRTLAYQYFRNKRPVEAVNLFRRVLSIDSLDYPSWINLAISEQNRGDLNAALKAYGRVRRLAPMMVTANDNINLEYATTYVLAGHLDSAAALIAELAAVPSELHKARALRSQSFLNSFAGHYAQASSNLADAIVLTQRGKQGVSEIRNRLLLATLLEERARPREAAVQVDSSFAIINRIDTEATMYFWVGKALARSGDIKRASMLLTRLEKITHADSPTDRAALEGLRGEIQLARRDSAAFTTLQQGLAVNGSAVLLESVAHAAMVSGRLGEAATLYETIASKGKFGAEGQHHLQVARYWLGRIREREGKPELARAEYERFLSTWAQPDSGLQSVVDARSRLEKLRVSVKEGTPSPQPRAQLE